MKLKQNKCKRCGHEWVQRILTKPVLCPRCKSPGWDNERIATLKSEITKAKAYLSDPEKRESAKEVIDALELRLDARRNQAAY